MARDTRDDAPAALMSTAGHTGRKQLSVVLWRRKWIALGTFIALTVLAAVVSKSLPKQYEATATLWVTEGSSSGTFDAVQAGQVLAQTYGHVAESPLLAERVAASLPFAATGGEVRSGTSFEPVSETQLLRITATSENPLHARVIANTYARVFIGYSHSHLGDAVNAGVTFASPATTPSQPARPQPTLYTLGGALIGLALGLALALIADVLDPRVRSTDELEALAEAPILARLPRKTGSVETELAFDETIRLLRTNLQFLARGNEQLHSIVVASPSVGDGKSTVSFQLARSFAESATETILIEADMRRPSLRSAISSNPTVDVTVGLSNYLAGKADLSAVLHKTDLPFLRFVPAGIMPSSPSALFNAERAQLLLADALKLAEVVIIDTPPLSVGAEANTLAASADGVLLVLDPRKSTKPAIRRATRQLAVLKASLLGIALNSVRTLPDVGAYAYHYQHEPNENGAETKGRRGHLSKRRPAPPRA